MNSETIDLIFYEHKPTMYQKSFYKKAWCVEYLSDIYLVSYETPMLRIDRFGTIHRLSARKSLTTSRHIHSFLYEKLKLNLTTKDFYKLPLESQNIPFRKYVDYTRRGSQQKFSVLPY